MFSILTFVKATKSVLVILFMYFRHILPGTVLCEWRFVHVFELVIYAKKPERACPKGPRPLWRSFNLERTQSWVSFKKKHNSLSYWNQSCMLTYLSHGFRLNKHGNLTYMWYLVLWLNHLRQTYSSSQTVLLPTRRPRQVTSTGCETSHGPRILDLVQTDKARWAIDSFPEIIRNSHIV